MTNLDSAIMARGDDLRERIIATKKRRQVYRDWTIGHGLELTRLIQLYTELLVVIEKHERAVQLAKAMEPA